MQVIKRDGQKEPLYFDKISARIGSLCYGELEELDYKIVAHKTIQNLYDEITTQELDELSSRIAASMATLQPLYGILASRICISNLQKMTPDNFYECCNTLMKNRDINGDPSPLINDIVFNIIEKNKEIIQKEIDYNRDFLIDFFGFKTLERAYLLRCNGKIIERPQHMWMRVAIAIHRDDIQSAFETYHLMSNKIFTHASPTLFNAGTRLEQMSSCFLTGTGDSIEAIFKTITNCAYISKTSGGVGIHVSNIRSSGALIRTTNRKSDGIIPMLQVLNYTARYINQGGRRPGSFAIYLEPWHPDVFGFLDLRKNTGSETERARDLFLALWIPDLFMQKVMEDSDWYLMCPDQSPGLTDVYGEEFNKLYNNYISENRFKQKIKARKLWKKIIESQIETGTPYMLYKDHVNRKSNQKNIGVIRSSNLCTEIVEYSDDKETAVCNLSSIALNHFVRPIKIEKNITLYSKTKCVYCHLSKMLCKNNNIKFNVVLLDDDEKRIEFYQDMSKKLDKEIKSVPQIFIEDKYIGGYTDLKKILTSHYDFEELKRVSKINCKNLNKVIDINYYPIPEARLSNFKHRPIGIGVQGLADTYFLMRFPFDSNEARELNKQIFETIYYGALEASMELSKERGEAIEKLQKENIKFDINNEYWDKLAYNIGGSYVQFLRDINRKKCKGSYSTFIGSPFSEGILQFDMWDVKPSKRWDWDTLKQNIVKYGTRNSLLTTLMPTASTSQILGNNECFEPITSNIYKRRTQAGEFNLTNKYLVKDLTNLGLWNEDMKNTIIYNNGSIQEIENIPNKIKNLYKTVWEIKQKFIVSQAAERGPYIDQTQSMNIFMENAAFDRITSSHFTSWKLGLKTGMYYFRTKAASDAIKFTINENKILKKENKNFEDDICLNCSA